MNSAEAGVRRRASYTGLFALLASVIMFFGAFSSEIVTSPRARKAWKGVPAPNLRWVDAAVLLLSSGAAERGRGDLRHGNRVGFNIRWSIATVLGAAFGIGQIIVWRQLRSHGVYVNSHPGSAFFYVATIAHALHLAGGWLWMI